ncbi:MAG: nucleoside-diphosphate sugar epimerase/dehydratase [Rikenellaceae bacterium]
MVLYRKITNQLLKVVKSRYLPKAFVLFIDMFFVFIAYAFVLLLFTLSHNATMSEFMYEIMDYKTLIVLGSYTIMFVVYRSYMGILRYSNINDMKTISMSIVSSLILLWVLNVIFEQFHPDLILRRKFIFLQAVVLYVMIVIMRLSVKFMYQYFDERYKNPAKRAVILNIRGNIFTKIELFNTQALRKYKIIIIINSGNALGGKRISNVPIINIGNDEEFFNAIKKKHRLTTLLIDAEDVPFVRGTIADRIIDAGFSIQVLNSVEEYNAEGGLSKAVNLSNMKIEDLLGRSQIILDTDKIREFLFDKVVIVTGAAGSIGSEIARQVVDFKVRKIILFDNAETPLYTINNELQIRAKGVEVIPFIGSVYDKAHLETCFAQYSPDAIFHAAAYKHVPMMEYFPTQAIKVNVLGTKNVADLAVKYNVDKFVMVSTDKAVNPTNIMGATKRTAEMYVQSLFHYQKGEHKTKFITTRFGNVLGSNGSVVPLFKKQIEEGGPVTITDPNIERYFMTIPEACSLVLQAGCMGNGGEIYVFDMGSPMKIMDLAKKMIKLSGLKIGTDIDIKIVGLRPGEKITEELLSNKENTLPTYNNHIMVAKVRECEYLKVLNSVEIITSFACDDRVMDTVKEMKQLVPEFISNNSIFEKLDKA